MEDDITVGLTPWMISSISRPRSGRWTWSRHRDGQGWRHWCTRTTPGSQLSRRFFPPALSLCGLEHVLDNIYFKKKYMHLPKHFMLDLELQFRFECFRPICPDGSRRNGFLTRQGLVDLDILWWANECLLFKILTLGQVGTSSKARSVLLNLSWIPKLRSCSEL